MMDIFGFLRKNMNCFKMCGNLLEIHIEFHNETIKSRLSIQCEQNVIDVQFYINKKYAQQEYYDFIEAIGIPHKWIEPIDKDKYTLTDCDLIAPKYTGKVLIYSGTTLTAEHQIPYKSNTISKLFISGNISSSKNDKVYFNGKYIQNIDKNAQDKLDIQIDGIEYGDYILNECNDEVRGIKICY